MFQPERWAMVAAMLLRSLAVLLLLLLPSVVHAQDGEFRSLKLSDGRTVIGEVVESTAEGMVMRVPQGTLLVRYEHLLEIGVIDSPDAPPLRIAVAPSAAPDSMVKEAAQLDSWLHETVATLPNTAVTAPGAWADLLGDKGFQLLGCRGDLACLQPMAKAASAELLIVPRLTEGPALVLDGFVVQAGGPLGSGSAPLAGTRSELAPHMIRAAFSALGFTPEADIDALAATVADGPAFATVSPPPGAEPTPVVEPEPVVAEPEPELEPEPVAQAEPKSTFPSSGQMTVTRTAPARAAGAPRLGTAVALGFVPVPGLNSAYLRDMPGFIISLVGSVALGAVAVYTLGSTVRWERPFVASSILVPYAIGVTFNQVSGLVGWNRLYGKKARAARLRWIPQGASVAPVLTAGDGERARATGAAFSLVGRF